MTRTNFSIQYLLRVQEDWRKNHIGQDIHESNLAKVSVNPKTQNIWQVVHSLSPIFPRHKPPQFENRLFSVNNFLGTFGLQSILQPGGYVYRLLALLLLLCTCILATFFCSVPYLGGFHLHLLVFPFVYQFNSIIGVLVNSSFANDQFRIISTTFQHHFKIFCCGFYMKKNVAFTLISFAVLK